MTILQPSDELTFQLLKIALKNKDGEISDHCEHEEHIKAEIDFRISKQLPNYYLHFNITNVEEIVVYVATDEELSENYHAGTLAPSDYQYSFELPKSLLKPGKYDVNLSFCNQFYPQVQTCADILSFEIIDTTTARIENNCTEEALLWRQILSGVFEKSNPQEYLQISLSNSRLQNIGSR